MPASGPRFSHFAISLILCCLLGFPPHSTANDHYPINRDPLLKETYVPLPLGEVKPSGWLRDQLEIQARGLTGNIEEFWPDLGPESGWKGGQGESWERGPYYLDGLVPLAYLLEDKDLQAKARVWIEWILNSGREDGWFGPEKNTDRWPLAVALKVLTQYHEASGDPRVLDLLKGYFRFLNEAPGNSDKDTEWYRVRGMETVLTAYWLYNRTGDETLLEVAKKVFENSYNWPSWAFYFDFQNGGRGKYQHNNMWTHNVNIGMAFKYPAVWYQQSGEDHYREAVYRAFENLDRHHGQVHGLFGGDEHLAGTGPTQGLELCGVVESMFSLENLLSILGDPRFGDRLERIAYNALPGTITPDFWAHQYDQQVNQVLCTVAKRAWSTNGNHSNIYGLEPNYGCCTANMHQGWPKLVSHLWMATHDNGLAAVALGPSVVEATVAEGKRVRIRLETDYPFREELRFHIESEAPISFPLSLRIPAWADGASVKLADRSWEAVAGTFLRIEREWSPGEVLEVVFPMPVRMEDRPSGGVSFLSGPLVYSLKIGEHFHQIGGEKPHADYEVYPTTPWNYGLILDRGHLEESIGIDRRVVTEVPFSNHAAPVALIAKAMPVAYWNLVDNSAGPVPSSPAEPWGDEIATVELIPYGCTRLRITEFPLLRDLDFDHFD
jgi:hypothetical protein